MKGWKAIAAIVLLAGLTEPSPAYPLPASSAERAARYEDWRGRLELAERSVQEGDWTSAEGVFAGIVQEGRALDDRSLLLARALDGLARTRARAGELEEGVRLYDEAAELFAELLGPQQPRLAVTLTNLGTLFRELDRLDEARSAFERALAIFESTLGPASDHAVEARRALSQLARRSGPAQLDPGFE